MSCPDVNDLIDLWQGRISDPEMEAHAKTCSECRQDLALFETIRGAYQPQVEVSQELDQRILASLDRVVADERKRSLRWNTLGSVVLGGLTVAAAVVVVGGWSPTILPIALVGGTMAGGVQLKWPGEWKLSFS